METLKSLGNTNQYPNNRVDISNLDFNTKVYLAMYFNNLLEGRKINKEDILRKIRKQPNLISYIINDISEEALYIIALRNPKCFEYIPKELFSDKALQERLFEINNNMIDYFDDVSEDMLARAIHNNPSRIIEMDKSLLNERLYIIAVRGNPYILRNIENQTENICNCAVRECGHVLKYVKDQTAKIKKSAVQQSGLALEFVDKQTPLLCKIAVKQNSNAFTAINIKLHDDLYKELLLIYLESHRSLIPKYINKLSEEDLIKLVTNDPLIITMIDNPSLVLITHAITNANKISVVENIIFGLKPEMLNVILENIPLKSIEEKLIDSQFSS